MITTETCSPEVVSSFSFDLNSEMLQGPFSAWDHCMGGKGGFHLSPSTVFLHYAPSESHTYTEYLFMQYPRGQINASLGPFQAKKMAGGKEPLPTRAMVPIQIMLLQHFIMELPQGTCSWHPIASTHDNQYSL